MAIFTLAELDNLSQGELSNLIRLGDNFKIQVRLSIRQRELLLHANEDLRATVGTRHHLGGDLALGNMNNLELYANLRFNGHEFQRLPVSRPLTLRQAEALTDDEVIALSERGGVTLELDDAQRDVYLRARADWLDARPDLADALAIDETTASNWNLYADTRINGIPLSPMISKPMQTMGM